MADLLIPIIPPKIREKVFRQHKIFLDDSSDEELRSRYRFGRDSIEFLTEILENHLQRQTKRNHALSPTLQILLALDFFVSSSFLATTHRWHRRPPKILCLKGGKRCVACSSPEAEKIHFVAVSRRTVSSQARVLRQGRIPWCNWLRRRNPCEDSGTQHERKRFC